MIQLRSILDVADNTGARKAAMISRKGQNTFTAFVGDIVKSLPEIIFIHCEIAGITSDVELLNLFEASSSNLVLLNISETKIINVESIEVQSLFGNLVISQVVLLNF